MRTEVIEQLRRDGGPVTLFPPIVHYNFDDVSRIWDYDATSPPAEPQGPAGLYLHIPFCGVRCHFCYFTHFTPSGALMDEYVPHLIREAEMLSKIPWVQEQSYSSVYVGGGTPTILKTESLQAILQALPKLFPLTDNCEICVEVRPGNEASQEKLDCLRECGTTRVSMGAQTLSQEVLNRNGRAHSIDTFYTIYDRVRAAGIRFVNVDLMSGLPYDNRETWSQSIDRVITLGPENITCYKTHTYRGSEMERLTENDSAGVVSEEEELDMFQEFLDRMEGAGYRSHDISYTFSKTPEYIHEHRLQINRANQYLAMGVSGNGYMNQSVYQNVGNLSEYQQCITNDNLPIKRAYRMDRPTMLKRAIIHGLRRGVMERQHFANKFGRDPWDVMQEDYPSFFDDELVEVDGDELRLVKEALPFADHVARRYVLTNRERKMEQLLKDYKNVHVLPRESITVPQDSPNKRRKKMDIRDPRR